MESGFRLRVERMNLVTKAVSVGSSFLLLSALFAQGSTHEGSQPEFDVLLPNLTVKQGSDVSYTCIVKRLGAYRVAWIRSEDKAIIALHNHMVTHNHRFSVTHNGHNTWTLHIKNVQQNDSGSYMCQINTDPQRSQYGTLEVVVPADIIDEETSNDVIVKEGQAATLKCKATGYPPPTIKWRREDGQPLPIGRERQGNLLEKLDVWEGESLPMRPLQRTDTGPYLCIANNSVPPRVSKRVTVYVHFHPSIKVSNQLVAAPAGVNVTLECFVEAVPKPAVSWFNKENQPILNKPGKVWQETEALKDYFSIRMKLTIANLRREDFTEYNCTAGNSIGSDYATIKLQQLHTPPTTRPSTTTKSPELRTAKHGKHSSNGLSERDSNGNPIKHSKNNKRNHTRTKTMDHLHEEDFGGGSDVLLDGFTTSSSFAGTANVKRNDSPNRRLDNPNFPGEATTSSASTSTLPSSPSTFFPSLKRLLLQQTLRLPTSLSLLPVILISLLNLLPSTWSLIP